MMPKEGRFCITSKNYYLNYKIALGALVIGSVLGGIMASSIITGFVGFILGFIIVSVIFYAFRKHIGDYVAVTKDYLIICRAGKIYNLQLDQIVSIIRKKYKTTAWYEVYPCSGKKIIIGPSGYENGKDLEESLNWFIHVNQINSERALKKLKENL